MGSLGVSLSMAREAKGAFFFKKELFVIREMDIMAVSTSFPCKNCVVFVPGSYCLVPYVLVACYAKSWHLFFDEGFMP